MISRPLCRDLFLTVFNPTVINTLMELLKFSEVQAIPEERWTTFLFGYRKKLLDAARDNSYLRDHVFQNRDAIAQVFYAFGGELLEETGNTFLHLESADELLNYCEEKPAREAARETAKKEHWTGYHVLSDEELSPMQIQHIRDCTKTGFKVGKPNDISFNQLLYLEERDKRPIYIEGALTQDLVYQLEYLFVFQPYLKEKTYNSFVVGFSNSKKHKFKKEV